MKSTGCITERQRSMRSKRIHSPTWKHLALATFLAFLICPAVNAQSNARPIEIAVVGFGDGEIARKVTEQLGESFRANLRSEDHTSELQSQSNLVCRLLLEKKKKNTQSQVSATHDGLP